jgi:cytosine/adenosine deaminase-related metal-dependent hydrolase
VKSAQDAFTIRGRQVLSQAGESVDGGWVRIVRGRVAACGRGRPGGRVIDLDGCIVLPGLVNAHTHLEFSALPRPLDPAGGLPRWIERVVDWRRDREARPDAAASRVAALHAGLAESAAAGVTTIGEIATILPPAGGPPGPRCRVFREALGLSASTAAAAGRRLARDVDALGCLGLAAGVSPHAPYSVSAALGRDVLETARRRGLPAAMHLAEAAEEAEFLAAGTGPLRDLLERLGAWPAAAAPRLLPVREWISRLARAGRGLVVHGTHLDEDEAAFARLARHRDRLAVVVCPRTSLALAGRLPPVRGFLAAGIRVAVGTDSRASSPDLSVLAECRTLVEAGVASPIEALAMATRDAAWGLGLEARCGRLAPGRPADLAVLRPTVAVADIAEAVLDPATRIVATLRGGRPIAGSLDS